MMNKRHFLTLSGSALVLAGCGDLLGPPAALPIYAMRPEFAVAPPPAQVTWSLAIMLPNAASVLNTDRIALQQSDGLMDYYASAQYPEPVPALVQRTLMSAFEASAAIGSLSREADALHSDYYLFTDIRAFEARYAVKDGVPDTVVTLGARLVTTLGRTSVGNTVFSKTAKASANSVSAVAAALSDALGAVASELVTWTLQFPSPATPVSK